jgi:PAS domain S-box-containing protein
VQWQFEYTGYIWLLLGSVAFAVALCIYGWRHRTVPGATAFAWLMGVSAAWCLFGTLKLAGADFATKLFWFEFQDALALPLAVGSFSFSIEYSGLSRWLTRRTLAFLLVPAVVSALPYLAGDPGLLWTRLWLDQNVRGEMGPLSIVLTVYGISLLLLATVLFAVLFVRSPLHRKPVALILLGHLGPRVAYPIETLNLVPASLLDPTVLALDFTSLMYAIALFRFRLFDVVPVARETVIDRMRDGMVVLDALDRLVDLNPAAEQLLGILKTKALGRGAAALLSVQEGLREVCAGTAESGAEIQVRAEGEDRYYEVRSSPLTDRRGFSLGRLITFRDMTESKRAQALLIEQQRALATLQERDLVARELHDGLGQVLGFVKMQAQAAQGVLATDPQAARSYLAQLVAVAQDAHADIREYILGARTADDAAPGFLAPLRHYLERFSANYGLAVELAVPPELGDEAFGPAVQVQLLRIIQESLTNARKHAHANQVQVKLVMDGGEVEVTVSDDGQGFDPTLVPAGGQKYGLRFMRERAEEVGGTLEVRSAPARPTRVMVRVPRQSAPSGPAPNLVAENALRE